MILGCTTFFILAGGVVLIAFAIYHHGFEHGYDEGHSHGFDQAKGPTLPPIDHSERGRES